MDFLTWVAAIALFFYLVPLARGATMPVRAVFLKKRPFQELKLNPFLLKLGRIEYLMGSLRDRILAILLIFTLIYQWITQDSVDAQDVLYAFYLVAVFNLMALLEIRYRDGIRLQLAEVLRVASNIHPDDIFKLYYLMLSPWPPEFPTTGFRKVEYDYSDYRTQKTPVQSFWPNLEATASTNTLARLAMLAFSKVGPDYGREAFDGLARFWGSRVAQLFNLKLRTQGIEAIPPLEGKTILLFNHRSYLDFALNFFCLGKIKMKTGRHLRPRFMVAKDHFMDNPVIHSWLNVGKAIEDAGMIFVDRKKGKGWQAMQQAAQSLMENDVEIAVYPQGTRALPLQSSTGERRDAGFYNTFTKKSWDQPLGHLKPGTAHLILDSLLELKKRGGTHLNVLVSGIKGVGIAGPKSTLKIQTENEIIFNLAPLWKLSTSFAEGCQRPKDKVAQNDAESHYMEKIKELRNEINTRLIQAIHWHEELTHILKKEAKQGALGLKADEVESLLGFLEEKEKQHESLPFILVERILTLKPELWPRFFRLMVSLREKSTTDPAWKALLQEVSERVLER